MFEVLLWFTGISFMMYNVCKGKWVAGESCLRGIDNVQGAPYSCLPSRVWKLEAKSLPPMFSEILLAKDYRSLQAYSLAHSTRSASVNSCEDIPLVIGSSAQIRTVH